MNKILVNVKLAAKLETISSYELNHRQLIVKGKILKRPVPVKFREYFFPNKTPSASSLVSSLYVSCSLVKATAAPFKSSVVGNLNLFRSWVMFMKKSGYKIHLALLCDPNMGKK
jgi:hypothetical protein